MNTGCWCGGVAWRRLSEHCGVCPWRARGLGGCALEFAVQRQDGDPSSTGCLSGLLTSAHRFPLQMEHLKACAEIAAQRTVNWQKFCIKDDCKQRSSSGLPSLHCPFESHVVRPPVCQALAWMPEKSLCARPVARSLPSLEDKSDLQSHQGHRQPGALREHRVG